MPDKRTSPVYYNKMKFAEGKLSGSKKLLDVGCGEGGYFRLYESLGISYEGIDTDASLVAKKKHMKLARAESIPFPDASFDTVVCMDVVEHVENPDKVMSEIRRVLKPGGKLIISVPSARYPWTYDPVNAFLRLFGNCHLPMGMWAWGHRRLYKRDGFLKMIEGGGFRTDVIEERTHGFVTAFMGYLPYLSVYLFFPLLRGARMKKVADIGVHGAETGGFLANIYSILNGIDRKHFGGSHGVTLCAVARKT